MITDAELIEKYDRYYTLDKAKWTLVDRDRLAFESVNSYVPEPVDILDVGCGNGHTLEYFKARHTTAKLYGIDLSSVAIDIAKKKLPEATFYVDFLQNLKGTKKWQVIICLGSAEHFTQLEETLKKMKSLLKKDGVCYMEIPHNLAYSKGEHNFRQLLSGSHQYEWHLDKDEWEAKFIEAGFEIKKFYRRDRPQWEYCWILA